MCAVLQTCCVALGQTPSLSEGQCLHMGNRHEKQHLQSECYFKGS